MRRSLLMLFSLAPLALLHPAPSLACPGFQGGPAQAVINGVSPQVGIAGITYVYINGYCFGSSAGTITLNGETMIDVPIWNDAEIEFQLPFDATSGDLVVTTTCCGADSTQIESQHTDRGNNDVNATFEIVTPSSPPLCCDYNVSPPAPYVV